MLLSISPNRYCPAFQSHVPFRSSRLQFALSRSLPSSLSLSSSTVHDRPFSSAKLNSSPRVIFASSSAASRYERPLFSTLLLLGFPRGAEKSERTRYLEQSFQLTRTGAAFFRRVPSGDFRFPRGVAVPDITEP